MKMTIRSRMAMNLQQILRPELRLSVSQRQLVMQKLLILRLHLIRRLTGTLYSPSANCNRCGYHLTPLEILKGFRPDPIDYNTTCPKCKARHRAELSWQNSNISATLQFYCALQCLDILAEVDARLSPAELQSVNPSLYHSLTFHYGTLKVAFAKKGVRYSFKENVVWHKKVKPFLGKLSDRAIADCVGVPAKEIRTLRRQLKIDRFRHSQVIGLRDC